MSSSIIPAIIGCLIFATTNDTSATAAAINAPQKMRRRQLLQQKEQLHMQQIPVNNIAIETCIDTPITKDVISNQKSMDMDTTSTSSSLPLFGLSRIIESGNNGACHIDIDDDDNGVVKYYPDIGYIGMDSCIVELCMLDNDDESGEIMDTDAECSEAVIIIYVKDCSTVVDEREVRKDDCFFLIHAANHSSHFYSAVSYPISIVVQLVKWQIQTPTPETIRPPPRTPLKEITVHNHNPPGFMWVVPKDTADEDDIEDFSDYLSHQGHGIDPCDESEDSPGRRSSRVCSSSSRVLLQIITY